MELPPSPSNSEADLRSYLNRIERRLGDLDHSLFVAWWNQYAGVSNAGTRRWDVLRTRMIGREDLLRFVTRSLERPHAGLLTRRLELWKRIVEDALVEQHPSVIRLRAPLVRQVFAFRPKWLGRRVPESEVRERLRTHDDREVRRQAYESLLEIWRQVERNMRRLVEARNQRARVLGYDSFMDFRLRAEGLTLPALERFVDRVVRASEPVHRQFRDQFEDRTGSSDYYPWDSAKATLGRNPLPEAAFSGREMVPAILRAIRAWGFQGPARPFRIVQRSIPVGGMTLAVQIPNDVRVAVNPKGGWLHYMILAHEFGHAVQDRYTRAPTHLLRGPESIPGYAGFCEGIGRLFERLATDSRWLLSRPQVDPQLVDRFHESFSLEELRQGAGTAQWVWKEIQLYSHPTGDLAPLFRRADRRLFGFADVPNGPVADPFWIEAAFYSKSYLLGSLLAAQLRRALGEQVGGPLWPNRRVIPWLRQEWFRHGARFDWVPRVEEVTGHRFGVSDFLERAYRGD